MTDGHELTVQEKKEVTSKEEKTIPARYYVPITDIYETDEALTVVMEIPGAETKDVTVDIENNVLRVEAKIDLSQYKDLAPVYTEYNVGHYARSFALSSKVDQARISATLSDGVLSLTLNKVQEAVPRRIALS
ncbi:Hsp20/alpha crystallin family protein [Mycobacterium sp. KBS0706]|uniref:Hsp20/alpha crystallin family protein n=1 Tax=Mycobacterium sp. KBS0706 TaxID=2578109 RepID=UPI00163DB7EA|nr:Hsp20/alpha crystallin family protein [Mycobacterium sp. KBS0706]